MVKAKRARNVETPKQPSLRLRLRASYFYPDQRCNLSARPMPEDGQGRMLSHMLLPSRSSFGYKATNLLSWCEAPIRVKQAKSSAPVRHMSVLSIRCQSCSARGLIRCFDFNQKRRFCVNASMSSPGFGRRSVSTLVEQRGRNGAVVPPSDNTSHQRTL